MTRVCFLGWVMVDRSKRIPHSADSDQNDGVFFSGLAGDEGAGFGYVGVEFVD